ncbi:MAG TPA: hypothetical protein VMM92_10380, partial [Thermoanaerobaculia bacterium]|nr:hypothetical protein [Thermoanaerobaculia bacterium]
DVLPLPSACVFLTTIAVAPSQPQILYAGGSPLAGSGPGHDPDPACIARCQAFRSQDGGDSWSCLPLDTVDAFIVDPAAAGTLYALNAGTTGNLYDLILKSTDGGLTWQDASHGLGSLGDSGFLEVRTLAIDPSHSGHLFTIVGLFGTSLLFTSTDGGLSWSPSGLPLPSLTSAGTTVLSLVLDPRRPLVLYAGLLEGGILRTSDLGTTWTALTSGLPPIDTSGSLVADPQNPGILYAGTVGSGIYRIQLR